MTPSTDSSSIAFQLVDLEQVEEEIERGGLTLLRVTGLMVQVRSFERAVDTELGHYAQERRPENVMSAVQMLLDRSVIVGNRLESTLKSMLAAQAAGQPG